jgi:probable DNA repair protein
LVIAHDATQRRGEIERAFLKHLDAAPSHRFEFSLGIPLSQVGLPRVAFLLLRWLDSALEEHELDWLFAGAGFPSDESGALQSYMRQLRRRGLQRTGWTLDAFLRQPISSPALPSSWIQRMKSAQRHLRETAPRLQSPLDWSGVASQMLQAMGWPAPSQLTSAQFQAASRWQQVLDLCGSLGFDGRRVTWTEFLDDVSRTLGETLFAEESQDAPILIAGPAESAGLSADAVWFLGADENTWPSGGSTHPLLPIDVQREARMPHASPQLDWELAESITTRLLAAAPEVRFSYARQKEGVEMRPSRLIAQFAQEPQPLPDDLGPPPGRRPLAAIYEDATRVPLPAATTPKRSAQLSLFDPEAALPAPIFEVPGGSNVLTAQSQCAFKAFATARLGAHGWEPAQTGLTPSQRGQLLHAVLHSIWGEGPQSIRTFTQLNDLGTGLRSFVEGHVQHALEEDLPADVREQMPGRYLVLEEQRLARLVTEWLDYERKRLPFIVHSTEVDATTTIAGLTLKLRLDRVDRLNDGSLLVIDYKTGTVSQKSWDLPRPDDVQLPLYARFALEEKEQLGGLVFGKVRPGDMCFTGKVANAPATLDSSLNGNSGLVKNPLTPIQLAEWKAAIEQLAGDFLAGRADVDPRDYPKTCERCGLYSLCRVLERDDEIEPEEEEEADYD